jgi:hypothetical protein
VASRLAGYDLAVAFGAAIFRYHEWSEGGIRSERAESLADLARITKEALAGDEPRLIEIPERRLQAAG